MKNEPQWMTEEKWIACAEPADMLRYLRIRGPKKVRYGSLIWFAAFKKNHSPRKFRLLLFACCSRFCGDVPNSAQAELMAVAEQYIDVLPPLPSQTNILQPYALRPEVGLLAPILRSPLGLALAWLRREVGRVARRATQDRQLRVPAEGAAIRHEAEAQCDLIRDIFGNPFRPVKLDPAWLTSTVLALASQMYESRDFSVMPILADALQDAGCDNEDVLNHCRGPGPHARGCWVVDLVLGKE